MRPDECKYLTDTLAGRRARDPQFEARMTATVEGSINQKAVERQRQLDARTPEEREIEQRRYSLKTYGREHMKRYASPIVSDKPLGELGVEGDQISSQQIHGHNNDKSAPSLLRAHGGGGEKPGPCQDKNGRLILQNHSACPIRQVIRA